MAGVRGGEEQLSRGGGGDAYRVAAVVLNYRTPELTERCLASFLPELDRWRDVAVVVDNASGDDSVERLRRLEAREGGALRVVAAERNGGFAAGHNLGIRAVRAEAYLLLNSDTILREGALERLWKTLEHEPRAGAVSPRLEGPDGTPQVSCFRFHTPASELIAAAGTGLVTRLLRRYVVALEVRDEPSRPPWTSFAAVLLRRDALEAVGLLDEGYFMYFEDVDTCRAMRRLGWEIGHEPRARIVHLRGGSGPVKRLTAEGRRRPAYYYASRRRYFRRAYGALGPLLANTAWSLGRAVSWLRERTGMKQPHTVQRELRDNWCAK